VWQPPLPLAAAIIALTVATGVAIWTLTPRISSTQVARFAMTPFGTSALRMAGGGSDVAISPDGTRLVYVGSNGALMLRALDQLMPTLLTGLGEPRAPVFRPMGNGLPSSMEIASSAESVGREPMIRRVLGLRRSS